MGSEELAQRNGKHPPDGCSTSPAQPALPRPALSLCQPCRFGLPPCLSRTPDILLARPTHSRQGSSRHHKGAAARQRQRAVHLHALGHKEGAHLQDGRQHNFGCSVSCKLGRGQRRTCSGSHALGKNRAHLQGTGGAVAWESGQVAGWGAEDGVPEQRGQNNNDRLGVKNKTEQ